MEKPVGVLATKAKKVHLEDMHMKKLEGDSPSNITTLKCSWLDDVSDDILRNIEEFEGWLDIQNDEKWRLLFKNLHTFKYTDWLEDSVVVVHVINNPTLKNVRF